MKTTTYETIWRNKWLTSNATSIKDMIRNHMQAIEELQEMERDGIVGDFDDAGGDYIWFTTTDSELARKYGMSEQEQFDDECQGCQDPECCWCQSDEESEDSMPA